MLQLFLLLSLIIFEASVANGQTRIVGGQEAEPGLYTFAVYVNLGGPSCTGMLIASEWILTAAHCTSMFGKGTEDIAIAGHVDRTSTDAQKRTVKQVHVHPQYGIQIGAYDLALLSVEPFDMSTGNISLIKLSDDEWPQDSSMLTRKCTALGWGLVSKTREVPKALKYTSVVAKHGSGACPCTPLQLLQKKLVCLTTGATDAPCFGDSGGPLVCDGKAVGVTHMLMSAKMCKPWSSEQIRLNCGGPEAVAVYIYICPHLEWMHNYVKSVPTLPTSCDSTIIKGSTILIISIAFLSNLLKKEHYLFYFQN